MAGVELMPWFMPATRSSHPCGPSVHSGTPAVSRARMSSTKATTPATVRRCQSGSLSGSAMSAPAPARAMSSESSMSPLCGGSMSAAQCSAPNIPSAAKAPSRARSGCARAGGGGGERLADRRGGGHQATSATRRVPLSSYPVQPATVNAARRPPTRAVQARSARRAGLRRPAR